jgi:hypothetical protein
MRNPKSESPKPERNPKTEIRIRNSTIGVTQSGPRFPQVWSFVIYGMGFDS